MHAEPTTFGLKLLTWFSELSRGRHRLREARREVAVGKISGAVGTLSLISPEVEARALDRLGLRPEPVATQIVARDRHAVFFSALAGLATTIERCCVEIRHLQRSEVGEVAEEFTKGQKGSSAMPHKRNPILSENLSGLARLMRSYAGAAAENVVLWHERDISHSSVERVIAPDACELMGFMLSRFNGVVRGLVVSPERMKENLESSGGIPFSGALLVSLVDHGLTREQAYAIVQRIAFEASGGGEGFPERVKRDAEIRAHLSEGEIDRVFSLEAHLAQVESIFARTFKEYQE